MQKQRLIIGGLFSITILLLLISIFTTYLYLSEKEKSDSLENATENTKSDNGEATDDINDENDPNSTTGTQNPTNQQTPTSTDSSERFSREGWDITFNLQASWIVEDATVNPTIEQDKVRLIVEKISNDTSAIVWLSKIDNKNLSFYEYCKTVSVANYCAAIKIDNLLTYEAYLLPTQGEGESTSYFIISPTAIYQITPVTITGVIPDHAKANIAKANSLSWDATGNILKSLDFTK